MLLTWIDFDSVLLAFSALLAPIDEFQVIDVWLGRLLLLLLFVCFGFGFFVGDRLRTQRSREEEGKVWKSGQWFVVAAEAPAEEAEEEAAEVAEEEVHPFEIWQSTWAPPVESQRLVVELIITVMIDTNGCHSSC